MHMHTQTHVEFKHFDHFFVSLFSIARCNATVILDDGRKNVLIMRLIRHWCGHVELITTQLVTFTLFHFFFFMLLIVATTNDSNESRNTSATTVALSWCSK